MADDSVATTVTILHLSDTHNLLRPGALPNFPRADILLHTGDFSNRGLPAEFAQFDAVLAELEGTFRHRVVCFGNHDVCTLDHRETRESTDPFKKLAARLAHATHVPLFETLFLPVGAAGDGDGDGGSSDTKGSVLEPTSAGVRVAGWPWWPGHTWDYRTKITLRGNEADGARFPQIPDGHSCDILMTHGPQHGRKDEADGVQNNFSGSKDLRDKLTSALPDLHVHGHIHEDNGVLEVDGSPTITVNSAMKNRWGKERLEYPCHLIRGTFDRDAARWRFVAEPVEAEAYGG
jgi:calcineurin-like phosphoesterase family protein